MAEERKQEGNKGYELSYLLLSPVKCPVPYEDREYVHVLIQSSRGLIDRDKRVQDFGRMIPGRSKPTLFTKIPRSLSCDSVCGTIVALCPSDPWYDRTKIINYYRHKNEP
jgi:hypothetical protein